MEHSNLSGCLESSILRSGLWKRIWTYKTGAEPGGIATLTGISLPFLSFAFVTLNTERIDETTMKIVDSTMWRPGQILLPIPNTNESIGSSRTVPSSLRKRSGLNLSGSGYASGSCRIALKHSTQISQMDRWQTYHAFAIIIEPSWIRAKGQRRGLKKRNVQLRNLTFRNKISFINVILYWWMGNTWELSFRHSDLRDS